jgi:molybdate transport system ATP-binding protein
MHDLDIDIRLQRGSFLVDMAVHITESVSGVFGHSGSGKTTLLHCIAGLVKPERGMMKLNGEILFDAGRKHFTPPHRRHIGLVFQDAQLFPHLSVQNNLLYGYRRLKPAQRRFELAPVVELLEIGPLLQRRPGQLSGGEKQRVALGRALLYSPQLLLFDEPLAALDERLKKQILPFLRRVRDVGIPMLYISHSMDEILYLTQTVTLVDHGRIVGHGPYLDALALADSTALADGLDLRNVWEVTILENNRRYGYSVAALGGERVTLPPAPVGEGKKANISVRAAQIALSRQRIEGITIQNQWPGTILRVIPRRHGALVEIDAGIVAIAEVNGKTVEDLNLREGDSIYCLIKAQSMEYPDS